MIRSAVVVGLVWSSLVLAQDDIAAPDPVPVAAWPSAPSTIPIDVDGYLKAAYYFTEPADEDALIGSRNGFRLLNARLGVRLSPAERLDVVISAEGAAVDRNITDVLEGRLTLDLRDAFLQLRLHPLARVRAGQFKAPYNVETLISDDELPFVTRSVVTDGLAPPEGFTRLGLTLDRQLGVEVGSDPLGSGDVKFAYTVAVVNGNGQNALFNDNNQLAPVARLTLAYKERITLGANGYYNPLEVGIRPNRLRVNQYSAGGDLSFKWNGFQAVGMVLWRRSTTEDTTLPAEDALGIVAYAYWVHQPSGGQVGARFTSFDPSSVDPTDRTTEVTAMVGYAARWAPLRAVVQYTFRSEQEAVRVNNNSLEAMVQATW